MNNDILTILGIWSVLGLWIFAEMSSNPLDDDKMNFYQKLFVAIFFGPIIFTGFVIYHVLTGIYNLLGKL
jgi:hypothetical protein